MMFHRLILLLGILLVFLPVLNAETYYTPSSRTVCTNFVCERQAFSSTVFSEGVDGNWVEGQDLFWISKFQDDIIFHYAANDGEWNITFESGAVYNGNYYSMSEVNVLFPELVFGFPVRQVFGGRKYAVNISNLDLTGINYDLLENITLTYKSHEGFNLGELLVDNRRFRIKNKVDLVFNDLRDNGFYFKISVPERRIYIGNLSDNIFDGSLFLDPQIQLGDADSEVMDDAFARNNSGLNFGAGNVLSTYVPSTEKEFTALRLNLSPVQELKVTDAQLCLYMETNDLEGEVEGVNVSVHELYNGFMPSYGYGLLEDTLVFEFDPDNTYGSQSLLGWGTRAPGGFFEYSYVKFNISGLPAGVNVVDSDLCFYIYSNNVDAGGSYNQTVYGVKGNNQTWDELNITFNHRPQNSSLIDWNDTFGQNVSKWLCFNVSSWLNTYITDDYASFFVNLSKGNTELDSSDFVLARSKEYGKLNETPYLNITFTGGSVWTEGDGGVSGDTCSAYEFCGDTLPGDGEYNQSPDDVLVLNGTSPAKYYCWNVTNSVADHVDNDIQNISFYFLWNLTDDAEDDDGVRWYSKEASDTSVRPYINISYYTEVGGPYTNLDLFDDAVFNESLWENRTNKTGATAGIVEANGQVNLTVNYDQGEYKYVAIWEFNKSLINYSFLIADHKIYIERTADTGQVGACIKVVNESTINELAFASRGVTVMGSCDMPDNTLELYKYNNLRYRYNETTDKLDVFNLSNNANVKNVDVSSIEGSKWLVFLALVKSDGVESDTAYFSMDAIGYYNMTIKRNMTIIYPVNDQIHYNDTLPLNISGFHPYNDTMWYVLDGGAAVDFAWNTTNTTFNITGLTEGWHDIIVYANKTGGEIVRTPLTDFIIDILPPISSVPKITPSDPYTSDGLACNVFINDTRTTNLTVNFTWFNNSVITKNTGVKTCLNATNCTVSTIASSNTTKLEDWVCEVFPWHEGFYGNKTNSTAVTILNALPVVNTLVISPSSPWSNQSINATNTTSDSDGDSITASALRWYLNDTLQSGLANLSIISSVTKLSFYTAEMRVYDGTDWSAWKNSSQVFVRSSENGCHLNISFEGASYIDQNATTTSNIIVKVVPYCDAVQVNLTQNGVLVNLPVSQTFGQGEYSFVVNSSGNENYTYNVTGVNYTLVIGVLPAGDSGGGGGQEKFKIIRLLTTIEDVDILNPAPPLLTITPVINNRDILDRSASMQWFLYNKEGVMLDSGFEVISIPGRTQAFKVPVFANANYLGPATFSVSLEFSGVERDEFSKDFNVGRPGFFSVFFPDIGEGEGTILILAVLFVALYYSARQARKKALKRKSLNTQKAGVTSKG